MMDKNSWLHSIPRTKGEAEVLDLVCFPHAGGSASSFREWGSKLPEFRVWAAKYPGRGERILEPCETSITLLAAHLAREITSFISGPVSLLGHSMGAVVALEVAREMERVGVFPQSLIVSGTRLGPGPQPKARQEVAYAAYGPTFETDDDLIRRLIAIGGLSETHAESTEFRELILPYLRADGDMYHAYSFNEQPELHCPIAAIVGDVDTAASMFPWNKVTSGGFRQYITHGDHFYYEKNFPVDLIRQCCFQFGAAHTPQEQYYA